MNLCPQDWAVIELHRAFPSVELSKFGHQLFVSSKVGPVGWSHGWSPSIGWIYARQACVSCDAGRYNPEAKQIPGASVDPGKRARVASWKALVWTVCFMDVLAGGSRSTIPLPTMPRGHLEWCYLCSQQWGCGWLKDSKRSNNRLMACLWFSHQMAGIGWPWLGVSINGGTPKSSSIYRWGFSLTKTIQRGAPSRCAKRVLLAASALAWEPSPRKPAPSNFGSRSWHPTSTPLKHAIWCQQVGTEDGEPSLFDFWLPKNWSSYVTWVDESGANDCQCNGRRFQICRTMSSQTTRSCPSSVIIHLRKMVMEREREIIYQHPFPDGIFHYKPTI